MVKLEKWRNYLWRTENLIVTGLEKAVRAQLEPSKEFTLWRRVL